MTVRETVMFIGLLVGAVIDYRKKELPLWYLAAMGIAGIFIVFYYKDLSFTEIAGGIFVGGVFLTAGRLTGGGIGYGDGLLLSITGFHLGFVKNVLLAGNGLLFSCFFALYYCAGKKNKKLAFPFVPFLYLSYIWMLVI